MSINPYITDKNIISYLIRYRVRKAREINKVNIVQRLTTRPEFNYSSRGATKTEAELKGLLPSRRKWKKLNKTARYTKEGHLLNTIKKNSMMLVNTIDYYQKNYSSEKFVKNLHQFIDDLKSAYTDSNFKFDKPEIIPKLKIKNSTDKTCRPISHYSLKDRILICLTNKYFTNLFDEYFIDNSFAFRSLRKREDGTYYNLMHHEAFESVIEFKKRFKGKNLYVAECDIKKFYDSVNHTIIKKAFKRLIKKIKRDKPNEYDSNAERLFYAYLDSYTFNKNAGIYNKPNSDYFQQRGIIGGKFGWVENELLSNGHYKSFNNAKIGVPQGGALSGLVANVVLDYVDKQVLKHDNGNLLYVRYCDDMLIIHPDRDLCLKLFNVYQDALSKLKLVSHDPESFRFPAEFWEKKTKLPYVWGGNIAGGERPWIGFVGYEMHCDGHIRVRKRSLKKEIAKQKDNVRTVLTAIEGGKNKVSRRKIEESIIKTLIGMSVGHARLWNYKDTPNELCWVNGFKLLKGNSNKYIKIQMKRLDQSRSELIKQFRRRIKKMSLKPSGKAKRASNKQILYYGKPFSYFYNLIEKKN